MDDRHHETTVERVKPPKSPSTPARHILAAVTVVVVGGVAAATIAVVGSEHPRSASPGTESTDSGSANTSNTNDDENITPSAASDVPGDYQAKLDTLEQLAAREGGAHAQQTLQHWMRIDPNVRSMCHNLAHIVGRTAARQENPVELVTVAAANECDGGFMHGVLQTYAATVTDDELAGISELCDAVSTDARVDCVHGTGHLLTVRYPDDISTGLRTCTTIFDNDEDLGRCTGGVAMEFALNHLSQHRGERHPAIRTMGPDGPVTVHLTDDDLADPCRALTDVVPAEVTYECYNQIGPMWLTLDGSDDPLEVGNRCATFANPAAQACAASVGAWLVDIERVTRGELDDDDVVDWLRVACTLDDDSTRHACTRGAVGHAGVPRDLTAVAGWCDELGGAMAEGCRLGVGDAEHGQQRMYGVLDG